MGNSDPRVVPDIIEEHFEELDFLWEQREAVVYAPDWTLTELAEWEERAEAHLDGLRIAKGTGIDLVRPALSGQDAGAATAAALTFLAARSPSLEHELWSTFASGPDQVREGVRRALRHACPKSLVEPLKEAATRADASVRAAATDVLAFLRQPAPAGLAQLFEDPVPTVRARAFEAAGRFGGPWSFDLLTRALRDGDSACRRAALAASARLGMPGLVEACRQAVMGSPQTCAEALEFLGVVGGVDDLPILEKALGQADLAVYAVRGLGALGSPATIPLLIEAMRNDALAETAGRAFRRVTGAEEIGAIENSSLAESPSENEEDAQLETDAAPPDPAKAAAWWEAARPRFDSRQLWQHGTAVREPGELEDLSSLPLESRRDVYLYRRAHTNESTPDLELEARAIAQLRGLPPGLASTWR